MTLTVATPRILTGDDDPDATLADVLAHLRGHIDDALIGAEATANLSRIAGAVPAAVASFWGVEVRLGDPAPHADFLWEVRRDRRGAALLAGVVDGHDPFAALCARSPVWQAMREFAAGWGEEGLGAHVGNVWFEADVAAARSEAELDAALTRPCLFWGARFDRPGSDRALLAALPDLARKVFGLTLGPAPLEAAGRSLPDEAEIFQLGVMGGRAGTLTRLCLRKLEQRDAVAWLGSIGWPGDPAAAFDRVAPYLAAVHSFALNVDLLDGETGPKLGVELYGAPGDLDPAGWRPLFGLLEKSGLALPRKSAAVLHYPGMESFNQQHVWRKRAGYGYPVISRSIHHVKLVLTPEGANEAKAYLAAYRPAFDYGASIGASGTGGRDAWLEP